MSASNPTIPPIMQDVAIPGETILWSSHGNVRHALRSNRLLWSALAAWLVISFAVLVVIVLAQQGIVPIRTRCSCPGVTPTLPTEALLVPALFVLAGLAAAYGLLRQARREGRRLHVLTSLRLLSIDAGPPRHMRELRPALLTDIQRTDHADGTASFVLAAPQTSAGAGGGPAHRLYGVSHPAALSAHIATMQKQA